MRNLAFNHLRFYVLSPANGAFTLVPLPKRLKPRPPSYRLGPIGLKGHFVWINRYGFPEQPGIMP